VVAAAVLLGFGLGHVWVRLQVAEVGYGLAAAREMVARLELEQKELEAELATLTAPRRLEGAARQRLGMREPRPGQVMVLR
jgi:cell division protein FtsL